MHLVSRAASIGVSILPAAMVLTRIPLLARSQAAAIVMATTAPFYAAYAI